MRTSHPKKMTGAALILVLGVLSIISILSIQIFDSANNLTTQQFHLKQLQQSYWYAKAGEEYARVVSKDFLAKKVVIDKEKLYAFPITEGVIQIKLRPIQNCFNINSFSQRSAVGVVNRVSFDDAQTNSDDKESELSSELLKDELLIGIPLKRKQLTALFSQVDIDQTNSQLFADRLIDWLDKDNLPTGSQGAENTFYASSQPARLTPNQHTLIVEEMRDFLAPDYKEFTKIIPLLCSRPGDNKLQLNINQLNADNAAIMSAILLGKIDAETAKDIISNRPKDGFSSLDEFWQQPEFKDIKINSVQKNAFTLENRYFQIETQVNYKQSKFSLISLLRINADKKVHVISRQYGVIS